MFTLSSQAFAVTQDKLFRNLGCEQKVFTVTAYYSPVAGQLFYNTKNFKTEKILNGNGTHGASGKPVFNGMLAGPKSYKFGTKLYFPERGWGEISDRGGAIVEAGERQRKNDRIDIWVGKGEQGLIRALTRGVRDVKARVCPTNVNISKQKIVKNKKVGLNLDKLPNFKHFFLMSLLLKSLEKGDKSVWVRELQTQLIKLGYMQKGDNSGYFGDKTQKAVCNFQIKNKVLKKGSEWCGYFGVKTRQYLKYKLKEKGLFPKDYRSVLSFKDLRNYAKDGIFQKKDIKIQQNLPKNIKKKSKSDVFSNLLLDTEFKKKLLKGQKGEKVTILQHKLTMIGYKVSPTGYYGNQTIKAIKSFQLAHGLSQTGYLDEKTRKILNKIRL